MSLSTEATAWELRGRVRGGGAADGLWIVALRGRDLRESRLVAGIAPVDRDTGAFAITVSAAEVVYPMVASGCSYDDLVAERFDGCRRVFPVLGPCAQGAPESLAVQVPDLERTHVLWSGARAPEGPHRSVGFGLLGLLVLLAFWLLRAARRAKGPAHVEVELPLPRQPHPRPAVRWAPLSFAVLAGGLGFVGLGHEPLDLLEYSYFHEGVRPSNWLGVISNPISSELSHAPIEPLILRAVASVTTAPTALRLPSVLAFGGFVALVVAIARRLLDPWRMSLAGLLAATMPLALYYGRDATPYAFAGLMGAASVWLLLRVGDDRSSRRWLLWTAFSLTHVLGFFSHYAFAAVSAAQLGALLFAWWRHRPRVLAEALLAFAAALILPLCDADRLWTMVSNSSVRFALMSPVFSESPGAAAFVGRFLAVLTGLPTQAAWLALVTLPLVGLGLRDLYRRHRAVSWLLAGHVACVVLLLVFSHTMSTTVGGGRVYYAFRWVRPLLVGFLVPIAAAATGWRRWPVALLALGSLVQAVVLVTTPQRPAQDHAVQTMARLGAPGDAYAVLPASFYGDPFQYHLAQGKPPDLLTGMQARPLAVGASTMHGPLVEGLDDLPLETVVDRLAFQRLWVAVLHETNFGIPKFDEALTQHQLAALDTQLELLQTHTFPGIELRLYRNPADRAWGGRDALVVDSREPLRAERYLTPSTPKTPGLVELVLPGAAATFDVRLPPGAAVTERVALVVNGRSAILVSRQTSDAGPHWRFAAPTVGDRHLVALHLPSSFASRGWRLEAHR